MEKKLSIIIPSRPNIDNIAGILWCLQAQTFQDFQVFLVVDKKLSKDDFQELKYSIAKKLEQSDKIHIREGSWEDQSIQADEKTGLDVEIISNITYDFAPKKNASATRNYGIKLAKTPYIYLFDDDNLFELDHLEKTFKIYAELTKKLAVHEMVLTGTLRYRRTWIIQNQGFKQYNYRTSRPELNFLKEKKWDTIRMYSGNGLFWPTHIFQETLYDETLDFVAEDLDFSYRISRKHPLIVHRDLNIYHMEREKSYLDKQRIGNEFSAYRKAKHRIIFARKHAKGINKIAFWGFGLWGNSAWLLAKILLFQKKNKRKVCKSFLQGIHDGIFTSLTH